MFVVGKGGGGGCVVFHFFIASMKTKSTRDPHEWTSKPRLKISLQEVLPVDPTGTNG